MSTSTSQRLNANAAGTSSNSSRGGSITAALPSLGVGLLSGACLALLVNNLGGVSLSTTSSSSTSPSSMHSQPAVVAWKSAAEYISSEDSVLSSNPSAPLSAGPAKPAAASQRPPRRPTVAEAERCVTRFVKYTPSVFEEKWFAAATVDVAKREGLCQLFVSPAFYKWTEKYMKDCDAERLAPHLRPTARSTAALRPDLKALDPEVYSSFEYERVCYDGAEDFDETVNSPLILSDTISLEPVIVPQKKNRGAPPAPVAAVADPHNTPDDDCGLVCGGSAVDAAFVWPPRTPPQQQSTAAEASDAMLVQRLTKVRRVRFLTYIEPLVGIVRDPRICGWANSPRGIHERGDFEHRFLLTKSWLLVDPLATYTNASFPARRFLFDMGASTWGAGAGGASQSWFYDTYRAYGADLNEIYAWELQQVNAKGFFADIPDHLKPSYHYFNEGMSPAWPSWDNPMLHVLQRTSPDDFVVVKLDIDAGQIEKGIVDEIIGDMHISNRVDEFFFEHHVFLEILKNHWGGSIDPKRSYVDSLHLFATMRHRGVRAHSWV